MDLANGAEVPRVLADNYAVGQFVARDFLSRGFEHLAFFRLYSSWASEERWEGFSAALKDAGLEATLLDWGCGAGRGRRYHRELASVWLSESLSKLPQPLGVMATNDDVGVLAMDACMNAGLLVPEQVAIIGCDNDEFLPVFACALVECGYAS